MNNSSTLPGRKYCAINLHRHGFSRKVISKATNLSKSLISKLIKQRPTTFNRKKRKSVITNEIGRFLKVFFSKFSSYMGEVCKKLLKELMMSSVHQLNLSIQ